MIWPDTFTNQIQSKFISNDIFRFHVFHFDSSLFAENLRIVDEGVKNFTNLIHEIFPDDQTAFVFTSDHGMSDKGAHGAGTEHETDTPFLAWGAGVNHWESISGTEGR